MAFIMCLLSFVMEYVNLQSMFSLKLTFERGTLFSVGRYRLSAGMLAVPLLCSGFSHSRGSYVVIRNFVCVCVISPVLVVIGRKHVTRTECIVCWVSILPTGPGGHPQFGGVTAVFVEIQVLYVIVSQPPGRGPVPGPDINYTGPREVLLEFVILVF